MQIVDNALRKLSVKERGEDRERKLNGKRNLEALY